jgi:hypothetical protein
MLVRRPRACRRPREGGVKGRGVASSAYGVVQAVCGATAVESAQADLEGFGDSDGKLIRHSPQSADDLRGIQRAEMRWLG